MIAGAVIGVTVLVAATVQAIAGVGFALIVTPVLFLEVPPAGAIATVTLLGILLNLLVLFGERRWPGPAWSEVLPILAAAVPGAVCGLVLLAGLPRAVLEVMAGVVVVGAGLTLACAPVGAIDASARSRLAVGYSVGALATSTGLTGPPLALWLARRELSPTEVRDTLSVALLGVGIIAILTIIPAVSHAHLRIPTMIMAAAGVVAGHALGSRVFARLPVDRWMRLLRLVILAAGTTSIIAGVAALCPRSQPARPRPGQAPQVGLAAPREFDAIESGRRGANVGDQRPSQASGR